MGAPDDGERRSRRGLRPAAPGPSRATGSCARSVSTSSGVFKRLDVTSRSLFALIEPGSCFAGTLLELALAADRSYMLDGRREGDDAAGARSAPHRDELRRLPDGQRAHAPGQPLPRRARRASTISRAGSARTSTRPRPPRRAWSRSRPTTSTGTTRCAIALEERAAFSPDALTGMEASLRFGGPGDAREQDLRPAHRVAELDLPAAERGRAQGRAPGVRHAASARTSTGGECDAPASTTRSGSPTTSTSPRTAGSSARSRTGSRSSSTGGRTWGRTASRATRSTCAPRSAWTPRAGRTSTGCGCPSTAGGSSSPSPSPAGSIDFGDHKGQPAWQEVPGEYRGVAAPAHRDPGRHRARLGRAAAAPRPDVPLALRPPQPLPGQRGGRPPPVGHGLSARRPLRPRRPRGVRGAAAAALGRRGQAAHPRRLQRADAGLAVVLHVLLLHRPRRQVPARQPRRERLRSARRARAASC